jgi:hypothetical protein
VGAVATSSTATCKLAGGGQLVPIDTQAVAGPTGPQGPAGSARTWAEVAADGTLATSHDMLAAETSSVGCCSGLHGPGITVVVLGTGGGATWSGFSIVVP